MGTGEIQNFIYDHSTLRGLKLCNRVMRCGKALCYWCSRRRATDARQLLAPLAHSAESVGVLRLSLPTSYDLESSWLAVNDTYQAFTSGRFLHSRVSAWWTQREVTVTTWGAWNLHVSILLFDSDPARLDKLIQEASTHWVAAARSAGYEAHRSAQSAELWSNPRKAIAYNVKGVMHQKQNRARGDGHSPGDLLALYMTGDADASEHWHELEDLVSSGRRVWHSKGGALRKAK